MSLNNDDEEYVLLNICICNQFSHYEDSKLEEESGRRKGLWSTIFFVIIFPYTLR